MYGQKHCQNHYATANMRSLEAFVPCVSFAHMQANF